MEYICSTLPPTSLITASCPSRWFPQIPSMKVFLKVMRCGSLFPPLSSIFPKQLPRITLANALNLCPPILCSTPLANPKTELISSPTFYRLYPLTQLKSKVLSVAKKTLEYGPLLPLLYVLPSLAPCAPATLASFLLSHPRYNIATWMLLTQVSSWLTS